MRIFIRKIKDRTIQSQSSKANISDKLFRTFGVLKVKQMKKITTTCVFLFLSMQLFAQDTIQAKFSVVDVCDGEEAVFTNTSKVPVKFGGGNYYWTFGDGTTSTDQFPKHKYTLTQQSVEERWEVKLVVQSKSIPSEKDSTFEFVTIYPNPDPSFEWDVDNKGNTQDIIITSQGTTNPNNFYQWTFAGVVKSNDVTPTFVHADVNPFLDGSNYDFTLFVRSEYKCEATYKTTFNYNPLSVPTLVQMVNLVYPNPSSGTVSFKETVSDVVI
ncbi:MAG: hypothetical protein ACI8SE_001900, partial [Bacteroidia bacterium]